MIGINIPKHWRKVTIKDIAKKEKYSIVDGPFGTQMKVHEFVSSGIPLIEMQNIDKDKFIPDFRRFVTKEKFEEIKRSAVTNGDVIISKTGSLGYVAIIPELFERAVITSRLAKLSIDWNQIEKKFFFHYLIYLRDKGHWQKIAKGTTMKILNIGQLAETEVPLPLMPEQQAIVSKIEELLSDLENGKHQLQLAQQQLKVYRQSLLKWAFEGKLTAVRTGRDLSQKDGELPKGWKLVCLKEVCEIKRGKSKHRPRNEPSLFGGKYPFIQTGDIRNANGGYINSFSQTYNEKGLQQSKLWPKETLCITIAANIGETAILGLDACFPDSVVGMVSNMGLLLNKYTNYFFISYKSKLEELAPATAQKNINVDILEKVKIPLPTIEEQQHIVNELESKLTVCAKIEETINQSLQQAETLRQSILKKAFEGKLI